MELIALVRWRHGVAVALPQVSPQSSFAGCESPNDPKLSDRGTRRGLCAGEGGWGAKAVGAQAVTCGAVRCSAWSAVAVEFMREHRIPTAEKVAVGYGKERVFASMSGIRESGSHLARIPCAAHGRFGCQELHEDLNLIVGKKANKPNAFGAGVINRRAFKRAVCDDGSLCFVLANLFQFRVKLLNVINGDASTRIVLAFEDPD